MPDHETLKMKQAKYDDWLNEKVEAARAAIREGRVHTSEKVEAYFCAKALGQFEKS